MPLLLALSFGNSILRADTIYTNFDDSGSYATGTGLIVTNDAVSGASVAVPFTPSDNYNLTSIEFVASDLFQGDSSDVTIGIFADNGGLPGSTPLELFSAAPGGVFGDNVLVTTVSSILQPLLLADTQYWIGMNAAPGDMIIWNQNVTSANGFYETDGSGNWSASDTLQSQGALEVDGTVAYVPPPPITIPPVDDDDALPSAVPEPAAWLLMAGGIGALVLLRRAKRSETPAPPQP